MTLPRELKMKNTVNGLLVASMPVQELSVIKSRPVIIENVQLTKEFKTVDNLDPLQLPCILNLSFDKAKDFSLKISNRQGEELIIGYDKTQNKYIADRTRSGKMNFHKDFASKNFAPRFTSDPQMLISIVIDVSSIELFADDGLTVMTQIFFPASPYDRFAFQSNDETHIKRLEYIKLKSIWK